MPDSRIGWNPAAMVEANDVTNRAVGWANAEVSSCHEEVHELLTLHRRYALGEIGFEVYARQTARLCTALRRAITKQGSKERGE